MARRRRTSLVDVGVGVGVGKRVQIEKRRFGNWAGSARERDDAVGG